MTEAFLMLLAGGVLLATACPDPAQVPFSWLRLGGTIASISMAVALILLCVVGEQSRAIWVFVAVAMTLTLFAIHGRAGRRSAAIAGYVLACAAASVLISPSHLISHLSPVIASCAGIAALCGISLMEMLLGHAYLTACTLKLAPLRRMHRALTGTLIARVIIATAGVYFWHRWHAVEMLWPRFGLDIAARYGIGFVVPAMLLAMTSDCIRRRATQSATGILYVLCMLLFLGELISLFLVRDTGLPF